MNKVVKETLVWFFFGKSKNKFLRLLTGIMDLFVVYFIFVWFAPGIFFRNSYKLGNITFKCAGYEKYDGGAGEAEFHKACDEAMEAISHSELYNADIKISVLFCPGHAAYKLLVCNPLDTSIGLKRSLTPFNVIVVNKTSFAEMTAFGGAKANNERQLTSLLSHETAHVFARKSGLVNFRTPSWKEEGICEYIAGESSYPVQEGWRHFLAGETVESHSYDYFLYRVAVTYMRDEEGLSFADIVADKRKQQEVLDSARRHVQESGKVLF